MIEFQNVTVKQKEKTILDDFSLQIPDGVIMGLVGSDDMAKSCLLAVAGGVCKVNSGQIYLDDEPLLRPGRDGSGYELIGYMPTKYGFYENLSLEEYYEMFMALYHINSRYWEERVDEVLRLTELEEYKEAYINEIPADLYPLFYLARLLLHGPEWLFLDEPFSGLNISGRNHMIRVLLTLQDMGTSMVIHSQPFPEILDFYTDVCVLEEGKLKASGLIQDVYEIAMKQSSVRMHVIAGMDEALAVLKRNPLVERVTVNGMDVIFRFNGEEKEEAQLLSELIKEGSLLQNYMRKHVNIEEIFRGGNQ